VTSILIGCVPDLLEQGLPGFAKHESTISLEVVGMQLYLNSLLNQAIHTSFYISWSANVEFRAVFHIHDMFCYSQLLWLAIVKVCHVLFASDICTPACLSDVHLSELTWYTVQTGSFQAYVVLE
jgi:hypothetical protein